MIVNAIKTKCMVFGKHDECSFFFNHEKIEQVSKYKYLGTIIKSSTRVDGCTFGETHIFLCGKAQKAIFALKKKKSEKLVHYRLG